MNDYIRRDDVIKAIHGYWGSKINELPTENTEDGEIIADMRKANEYLEHNKQISLFIQLIETAEVAELKTGRWVEDTEQSAKHIEKIYFCSNCGNFEAWGETELYNYCPNCGAKMENEYISCGGGIGRRG